MHCDIIFFFFFSSRRRHTRFSRDWSSDVCSSDLHAALTERGIRGATIDVWYKYPPASGERVRASQLPFHELPNVVMTRHASGHTEETWERRFRAIAQNLEAFAQGRPLANVISEIGGRNTENR